jgi:hypothetical protein
VAFLLNPRWQALQLRLLCRSHRRQWPRSAGPDPAFALIAKKQAADVAHGEAISAQDKAEAEQGAGANGF